MALVSLAALCIDTPTDLIVRLAALCFNTPVDFTCTFGTNVS
jgi:hypothetical protein